MSWCLFGLLGFFTIQDPQPPSQAQQTGFEIVDLGPAHSPKKVGSTRKAKPIEIKMPKKKRGETKLTKPKKR
jgi:hypothetical protein